MKSLPVLTVPLLLLAACGSPQAGSDNTKPQVVAGLYPLAFVAERIAGDDATVVSLAAPGQEPHDLQLSLTQAAAIADADLVVSIEGFQPAVDDALADSNATVLFANDVVDLAAPVDHDHDEEGHDEEAHDDELAFDPHFWLDPVLLSEFADAVAADLSEHDPDHADEYADRLAALNEELAALDADYTTGLANCERSVVVVSHNAFGYLSRYGLEFEAIAGISPDAEPNPADLAALSDLVTEVGLTTVFSETLVSSDLSETLARETGASTAVLDPIEGLSDETADEDYVSLMRANLAALQLANGC